MRVSANQIRKHKTYFCCELALELSYLFPGHFHALAELNALGQDSAFDAPDGDQLV